MKRTAIIIASLLITLTAGAQTVNVHKTDGTVVSYPASLVYVDFTAKEEPPESYLSCPDANHPHLIDLGLPSGTLWACCNVGASVPEQYGNYYAWGETQTKSDYNWYTYKYGSYNELIPGNYYTLIYIGSDIAGTSYDAATVNWGASWRMPTHEQCKELINSCSSKWMTQNDVKGRKFTGPNGGTIFLPAAGYPSGNYAGSEGCYWSSSILESNPSSANCLIFYSKEVERRNVGKSRCGGRSVRPVR